MELGADGVQMGTRFVTTEECDASTEFKRSYIEASQQDIGDHPKSGGVCRGGPSTTLSWNG